MYVYIKCDKVMTHIIKRKLLRWDVQKMYNAVKVNLHLQHWLTSSSALVQDIYASLELTKAVFPARIRNTMENSIGYAVRNGIMDWSASDMPVLVYAETH
jgi:hypothetical protein